MDEQKLIAESNRKKQQDAIDLWHRAKLFPRKKKKQMRKEANKEYSFWVGIEKWHKEIFPIIER